ncbi:hypothetical protein [Bradyrhizobium sp. WSM1417]|uniref:hypothetical protein n=1 Tax=Bradyrhizobium sp. WSM1417 TaxID=754500 RepID=UPI001FD89D5D|nr:hypothetical protein [Bradyrhizobium sp. WSM1417]
MQTLSPITADRDPGAVIDEEAGAEAGASAGVNMDADRPGSIENTCVLGECQRSMTFNDVIER